MNFDKFFNARSIAIIGASRDTRKVGHVILRNLIDQNYKGRIIPINPNAKEILGIRCYPSVTKIKGHVDLAVMAIPAEYVVAALRECAKKGIKNVVIASAGFKEVGNLKLDKELEKTLRKYKMQAIGPNCLGIFNAYNNLDTLFNPRYKMTRPGPGGISFVCQSGAVGSAILDMATDSSLGFSKFVSYGNAMIIDESDIIEYLGKDPTTKVICLYVEGVNDGKKFLSVCKKVAKKKPIIAIKGGITEEGSKAALSHTGALAGSAQVYFGVFKQAGIINAEGLEEMFEVAKILEKTMKPKGSRIQIITNGGGYGILTTDAIVKNNLNLAKLGKKTVTELKKIFSSIVVVGNPIDLVGNATSAMYKESIEKCLNDSEVDIVLAIVLYQTPLLSTDVIDAIIDLNDMKKKPLIIVSTGGEFTELLKSNLENSGVPTYKYPENAVRAIRALVEYYVK